MQCASRCLQTLNCGSFAIFIPSAEDGNVQCDSILSGATSSLVETALFADGAATDGIWDLYVNQDVKGVKLKQKFLL